jgi:3-hydroxybutyryl-CoA dehydratase
MKLGDTYSQQFIITEHVYQGFIETFKDRNPLHVSEPFARLKGFPSVVMHGNILNGFISYFIGECLPEKNVMIYSQSIDYKKPVYLNDCITLNANISNVYESVNSIEIKFYFENQKQEKIAKGNILVGVNLKNK